ncbi:Ser-Thr-rich glycosyl-phosphatidyl-inositol-anchored membrane family-domain-containing protein [Kalaharituber pfeilii]|nr:Ser-Thr-rich glycosyl-phosphatidyl-inositol-anchored membrane family-domain-containing protein [Kalaharituber pfeilii]
MQFITSVAAVAALLAAVASAAGNGFITPQPGAIIPAGKECFISWKADTPGPVTIYLMKGDSKDLDRKSQVVLLETNFGNYTWDVPSSLPEGDDYAFKITWGASPSAEDVNYTGQFTITSDNEGDEDETSTTTKTTSAPTSATTDSSATETETETKTNNRTETVTTPSNGTTITIPTPSATETETATESESSSSTDTSSSPSASASEDEGNAAPRFGFSVALVGAAVAAIVLV